jgi:2-polyprenyl-3-methyl-5-hydroxy-6-metoxy-1,4-benzoquinol methylase/GNAT superfamily N-acetyltransferase
MITANVSYRWSAESELSPELLQRCAELFSSHYGIWSRHIPAAGKAGKPIRLSAERLRKDYLPPSRSWAALAEVEDQLVGYAFVIRADLPEFGRVDWVTQLVVHEQYRDHGVAKTLLGSAWGFSDRAAWGLVTPNPFAVRALEKATRRRCTPAAITRSAETLRRLGDALIPYFAHCPLRVDGQQAIANTGYFVDHSDLEAMLEATSSRSAPWLLGRLGEGEEWFAFTLQTQRPFSMSADELEGMFAAADDHLRSAYARMRLDLSHQWASHAPHEVDWLISRWGLTPSSSVLDFGCGNGRHAIEFAKRGFEVVGVDFADHLIERARADALATGVADRATFLVGDCRAADLDRPFDVALCLYDVIGSFADDRHNRAILRNMIQHVRVGGKVAISVMNLESTRAIAKHVADVHADPDALLRLKASSIMESTGNIFDPDYFILDSTHPVVYRKEQFSGGGELPVEVLVRDRRFALDEIVEWCKEEGVAVEEAMPVRAGRWNQPLPSTSERAKELLVVGHVRPRDSGDASNLPLKGGAR